MLNTIIDVLIKPILHFRRRMWRYRKQPLGWVFVSRMMGIISFLIAVVLANILTYYVSNKVFLSGVLFLNENFWLLILIGIIFFVSDIFGAFPFPLNLPFPIIRAIGSVFCIAFFLKLFQWVDAVASTTLYPMFWYLSFIIIPLVFLIVLAGGYYEIMRRALVAARVPGEAPMLRSCMRTVKPSPGQLVSDAKSWEDIGVEFRMMLYDLLHRFRQEIKRK